jgi:hypothetical protein
MRIKAKTKGKPCCIRMTIACSEPRKMYFKVKDSDKPNTEFTNRYCTIEGEQTFWVRMPISPEIADIIIKSENQLDGRSDDTYKIIDLKILPLKHKLSAFNSSNKTIQNYIKFCTEFCAKAGYISAGNSIYTSNDGKFRIDYLDKIADENGKSMNTPARISKNEGIIEVSKEKFKNYTIPMRMCILLHEFSHYYLNTDIANETEADLNGLLIYLSLGYPRIDAYNVFSQVFITAPNSVNTNRMQIIDKFIRNFEQKHSDMSYQN